jgi:hypothetical protein
MKTVLELDELKSQWRRDPCWDIEETEGFEDHKEELLAYRLKCESEWKQEQTERLEKRATELGCSVALVQYIERLEYRLGVLEDDKERADNLALWTPRH